MEAEEFKDRAAKTRRRELLALFDSYVQLMDKDRHALHRARFMEVLLAVKPEAEEKESRVREQTQMLTFDARYPLFDDNNNFVGWSDASNALARRGFVIGAVLASHGIDWKEEQKRMIEEAKFEAEALATAKLEMTAPAMMVQTRAETPDTAIKCSIQQPTEMVQVRIVGPKPDEPNGNGDVFSEECVAQFEGAGNRLVSAADVLGKGMAKLCEDAALKIYQGLGVSAELFKGSMKLSAETDSPLSGEALFQKPLKRAAAGRGHMTQKECDEEDTKNLAAFVRCRPQDSQDSDYLCDICGDIIAKGGRIGFAGGKKCHSSCAELSKPAPTMLERLLGEADDADAPTIIHKPQE